jgi:hypothetical protein
MTVKSTSVVAGPYYPDGVATVFPFDFKVLDPSEIAVTLTSGVDAPVAVDRSAFTVSLNADGNGGSVNFITPPAVGPWLMVRAAPTFLQQVSFTLQGAFLPTSHDEALDRAALRDLVILERLEAIENGDDPGYGSLRDQLMQAAGSGMVSFKAGALGAVARSVASKLADAISIDDYGAIGNPVLADDTPALQAAIDAAALLGGGTVTYTRKHRIASDLIVKPNVTLKGPMAFVGSPQDNSSAPYGNLPQLQLASTATIRLRGGAGLIGCLVFRAGMAFPPANAAAFAGTAITVEGDDTFVYGSMILGFNLGFYSYGWQRPTLAHTYFDCVNGLSIVKALDIPFITEVRCWPFTRDGAGIREGTAFNIQGICDWAKLTNCFSWGYLKSIVISGNALDGSCENVTVLNCGSDNLTDATAPLHPNSIGVAVTGQVKDIRIIGHQAAVQATAAVYVNIDAAQNVLVRDLNCWGAGTHGILIDGGDVTCRGGQYRGVSYGISCTNASSRVFAGGMRFQDIGVAPFNVGAPSNNWYIDHPTIDFANFTGTPVIGTLTARIIPSASGIAPASNSDVNIVVSGTTAVGAIGNGFKDRLLRIKAQNGFSLLHSTGSATAISTKSLANTAVAAGTMVTLVHMGDQWYQQ